jgi:hypothetical protein
VLFRSVRLLDSTYELMIRFAIEQLVRAQIVAENRLAQVDKQDPTAFGRLSAELEQVRCRALPGSNDTSASCSGRTRRSSTRWL